MLYLRFQSRRNQTESWNVTNKPFYGPTKSCEELLKGGDTRNRFYLVKVEGEPFQLDHLNQSDSIVQINLRRT